LPNGDIYLYAPDGIPILTTLLVDIDIDPNATFNLPATPSDGIVDGAGTSQVMNVGFTDAQGDQITEGADSIRGNDGNDSITAGGGNDSIDGGAGADTINAGTGDDLAFGGFGNDSILGEAGNDTLFGGEGRDTIDGGSGNDVIDGGDGNDSLLGGIGNDIIEGGSGDDKVFGGTGNDTIYGDDGRTINPAEEGVDAAPLTIRNNATQNEVSGQSIEYLNATTTSDGTPVLARITVIGKSDAALDVDLSGPDGGVRLLGTSALQGETVTFRVEFFNQNTGEPISLDTTATFADLDRNSATSQENVTINKEFISGFSLSSGSDLTVLDTGGSLSATASGSFSGTTPDDQNAWFSVGLDDRQSFEFTATARDQISDYFLNGSVLTNPVETVFTPGDDTLCGDEGDDVIYGEGGNDSILGADGNDTLLGGLGNDIVDGGIGDDSIDGGAGDDTLTGGDGNDIIYGGDAFTTTTPAPAPTVVTATNVVGADHTFIVWDLSDASFVNAPGNGTPFTSAGTGESNVAGSTFRLFESSTPVTVGINDNDSLFTDGDNGQQLVQTVTLNGKTVSAGQELEIEYSYSVQDSAGNIINIYAVEENSDDVVGFISDVPLKLGETYTFVERTSTDPAINYANIATSYIDPVGTVPGGGGTTTTSAGGNDVIDGGIGNDTIHAGDGSDTITGGLGADSIRGDDGDDDLIIGAGDTVSGGGGDDEFILDPTNTDGPGTITIDGGADGTNGSAADGANGDTGDTLDFTGLDNVTIISPLVDDGTGSFSGVVSYTNVDGDVITVNFTEIEKVIGLPTTDGIVDGLPAGEIMDVGYTDPQGDKITDGADSIRGDAGNDSITAGAGNDTVDAGADNDTVNAGLGDDSVLGGLGDDSLLGNEGNDTLAGNEGNDTIDGGIGNDSIDGGVGNDSLNGGTGNDTIDGGTGSDTIAGGPGADSINGGAGDDDIAVGGTDTVAGGSGDDVFTIDPTDLPADVAATIDGGTDGTDGNPDGLENGDAGDILDLGNQTADLTVTLTPNPETGTVNGLDADGTPDISFTEIEKVITGAGDDTVSGGTATTPIDVVTGAGDDSIVGGLGNDTIDAGADNDTVDAGAGDDSVVAGPGDDSVAGGAGNDTIDAGTGNDTVDAGLGNDSVVAGDGNDSVDGGAGNDTIDGGDGSDTLKGGLGNDSLVGGQGDDDFIVGSGDTVSGGSGDDEFILDPTNTDGPGFITIDGGTDGTNGFPDDLANGDDGDTLDFTGLNNVTIVSPLVDDGTGSFTGVVSYTNVEGETVIVSFTEIEKVLGLPNAPDGVVDGEVTGEVMDVGYNDANGPTDGGGDLITDGADSIRGNAGNDSITAGAGNDTVDAGADNDTVNAGLGDDSVLGGLGDDSLLGNEGNDTLAGNEGNDTIDGGIGNDSIDGGVGNDSLNGGDGNDTIDGGADNDTINGGLGNDSVFGGLGDDSLSGNAGDDTLSGDAGNDTIRGGIGNDIIDGGVGDDSLLGGDGNDSILGGDGNDTVNGGDGNDTVDGGIGDDVIDTSGPVNVGAGIGVPDAGYPGVFPVDANPNNDRDSVSGGDGNDSITTGDDDDTIDGGAGNDTINAGIDDDLVTGGIGDDSIIGSEGSDTIDAGDGNDTVYGGNDPALVVDIFNLEDDGTNPLGPDLDPNNGRDSILGGTGNDVLYGQDDDDTISGGDDDDFIDGGIDDDLLFGDAGNDTVLGGQGNDTIDGGSGNDELDGGIGNDSIDGGIGNDTIRGGSGNDVINGGDGNDEIRGGEGVDTLSGGDGGDLFIDVTDGDIIDGGSGDPATDFDVLNLTGLLQPGGTFVIENAVPDTDPLDGVDDGSPNDGQDGTVVIRDAGGVVTARIDFTNIESIVPCFTPGTLIATAKGQIRVEDLKPGDRVITRDNGMQEIAWVGQKHLTQKDFIAKPELKPVLIKAGSLGENMPERDMMVSPNHRMLIADKGASMYFDEPEVLAAAKHFVGKEGICHVDVSQTSYIHFMFERHEVVLSDGTWTESFYPGDYTIDGLGEEQRAEILSLFPELESETGLTGYRTARAILKKYEAKLLLG